MPWLLRDRAIGSSTAIRADDDRYLREPVGEIDDSGDYADAGCQSKTQPECFSGRLPYENVLQGAYIIKCAPGLLLPEARTSAAGDVYRFPDGNY